jgi:hypothetical protein
MEKKRSKKSKRGIGKIKGFSIQFLPYSEIHHLDSTDRIKKILGIIFSNNILLLQGRLKPEEEARLIGDTMAMIGHVQGFKGIELAVIANGSSKNFFNKIRSGLIKTLSGGDLGAITIIGPATIVKEIKRDPKKIELMLNK